MDAAGQRDACTWLGDISKLQLRSHKHEGGFLRRQKPQTTMRIETANTGKTKREPGRTAGMDKKQSFFSNDRLHSDPHAKKQQKPVRPAQSGYCSRTSCRTPAASGGTCSETTVPPTRLPLSGAHPPATRHHPRHCPVTANTSHGGAVDVASQSRGVQGRRRRSDSYLRLTWRLTHQG